MSRSDRCRIGRILTRGAASLRASSKQTPHRIRGCWHVICGMWIDFDAMQNTRSRAGQSRVPAQPGRPVTLLDSESPYGSRRVVVEYDGWTTAAYMHDGFGQGMHVVGGSRE